MWLFGCHRRSSSLVPVSKYEHQLLEESSYNFIGINGGGGGGGGGGNLLLEVAGWILLKIGGDTQYLWPSDLHWSNLEKVTTLHPANINVLCSKKDVSV